MKTKQERSKHSEISEKEILDFIDRNWGMIKQLEAAICGRTLDDDDLKSLAVIAIYKTVENARVRTGSNVLCETIFYYYFTKELRKQREFGLFKQDRRTLHKNEPPGDFLLDQHSCRCFSGNGEQGSEGVDAYLKTYSEEPDDMCVVHEASFKNIAPARLLVALKVVSSRGQIPKLRRFYKGDVVEDVVKDISELQAKGWQVYSAICRNGKSRRVLVCAQSETEAKEDLLFYGDLLELKKLDFHKNTASYPPN